MSSEYDVVPKSGKLKLKGTQDQKLRLKIEKKKKKGRMEKKSDAEERLQTDTAKQNEDTAFTTTETETVDTLIERKVQQDKILSLQYKKSRTNAQLRHSSMRQKQLEQISRMKATKTFKTRMEEYNIYLMNMSDHNSISKVDSLK